MTEIKGLNEVKNFLVTLADNLAQAVKEEIASEPGVPRFKAAKIAHRRPHGVSHRPQMKRGRRNLHVPGLDSRKRGGA